MAEETKNAAMIVPKAMITAYYINAGLAFLVTVTFCFVLVDYDSAINSPVGLFGSPFIQVFIDATGKPSRLNLLREY
jgi:amino acid transporter